MGGAKYISHLKDGFDGDLKKIIAPNNAGSGAVEKCNGVPPYRETRNDVNKVWQLITLKTRAIEI